MRFLAWYREQTCGIPYMGYYQRDSLIFDEKVVIPDNLPKSVEEIVVKHELGHHRQAKEGDRIYRSNILIIIGAVIATGGAAAAVEPIIALGGVLMILSVPVLLYEKLYEDEKQINAEIDMDAALDQVEEYTPMSKPAKYIEFAVYVLIVFPSNLELVIRQVVRLMTGWKRLEA